MLSDSCLACGSSNHFVADEVCPRKEAGWPDSAPIHCEHCDATIQMTALAATMTTPLARAGAGSAAVLSTLGTKRQVFNAPHAAIAPPPNAARLAIVVPAATRVISAAPVASAAPLASAAPRQFARVRLCGRDYTMIAWYLGKTAGESVRLALKSQRFTAHAVEFRHADSKTLANSGFAKTQRHRELLPGRTNLSSNWLDTECTASRRPHKPLQVRRGCQGRNVLWLVEDLVAHFSKAV